jgi:hypothetical protein
MSADTWLDDNNRHLAASLQWLRLKLRSIVPADTVFRPQPAAPEANPKPMAAQRSWFGRSGDAPSNTVLQPPTVAPPPVEFDPASGNAAVEAAAEQRAAAAQTDPPPALPLLAQRLGLSKFEADTLLLCAACELDPDIGRLISAAQGPGSPPYPSFSLALRLFDEPCWDALSPHRPLRFARLLEMNQPGATPLTAAALRADERIVHFIKGLNDLDERLSSLLTSVNDTPAASLSASQQRVAKDLLHQLSALGPGTQPVVMLLGADGHSKLETARAISNELGRYLYRLPIESLPATRPETEQLARLWQRECALLPLALYLDADELDGPHAEGTHLMRSFLGRELGLVFVTLREPASLRAAEALTIEIAKPTPSEQHDVWLEALQPTQASAEAEQGAARLASQYNLNLRDIGQAMALARGPLAEGLADRAWKACKQATLPRLNMLAQRIDARATWDDLVLGDEALQSLRQIAAQVRQRYRVYEDWGYARKMNRGLGISALFSGESGTGKTMAAEVIANELDLALYRIDLSAVVSKYIGETEKNLRRLFDAAETGGAILFFDEADALFGKRSEVKDSHDRYANIEVNYLLQRMESFSGLAILATNMRSALDAAFLRRLRFVVNFQYPGVAERRRLWQQVILPAVPHADLDYERLARFNLSGGNVASVALNAAFAAAQRNTPLTMPLLLSSLRAELRKLDKPVNETEFR